MGQRWSCSGGGSAQDAKYLTENGEEVGGKYKSKAKTGKTSFEKMKTGIVIQGI